MPRRRGSRKHGGCSLIRRRSRKTSEGLFFGGSARALFRIASPDVPHPGFFFLPHAGVSRVTVAPGRRLPFLIFSAPKCAWMRAGYGRQASSRYETERLPKRSAGRANTWSVGIRRRASVRVLSNQRSRSGGNGDALAIRPPIHLIPVRDVTTRNQHDR